MTPQEIADRLQIDALITQYAVGVDERDWDTVRACFTEDAILDYSAATGPRAKRDEVIDWIASLIPAFKSTQHLVVNRRVALDGDEATATAELFNPLAADDGAGGTKMMYVGGGYSDRLRRTPEGWRIVERVVSVRWSQGIPLG